MQRFYLSLDQFDFQAGATTDDQPGLGRYRLLLDELHDPESMLREEAAEQ